MTPPSLCATQMHSSLTLKVHRDNIVIGSSDGMISGNTSERDWWTSRSMPHCPMGM